MDNPRVVGDGQRPCATPRLVKNTGPRESRPLSSTIRALGAPSGSTVATTIAFGSTIPAATTSASQRWSCSMGSATRSASDRPVSAYARRKAATSTTGRGPSGATFVTPAILSQSGGAGCEG